MNKEVEDALNKTVVFAKKAAKAKFKVCVKSIADNPKIAFGVAAGAGLILVPALTISALLGALSASKLKKIVKEK